MSVTAVPSVSYLPIEWAGAVVPEGDAQAFGLAINDAGKILDQGLTSVESTLGAPGPAPAVDASSSGLQFQKWTAGTHQTASVPAATTTEAGDALISAGSEPMRFRAADDMPLPPQLGSRSATPAMPPRGRGTEAEAESELPQQMDGAAQELLGDPAQLLAAAPNVQSASRVAADKPPVASDGNAAASDIAVPDGALAPRADNVAVTGQQRPIEASGFAASMPDNQAGAAHAGVSRQDANVTNTDRSSTPVPTPPAALPTAPALQTSKGLGKGLALEMRKSIEDGREHMRVRLDPKELGQLDVRLSFEKDGALRAIITASTSASNDLLRQELPTLVRNLSDAGVRMDEGSLRFELQSGSGGGSGQRQTPQEERRTPSRNGAWEDLRPEEDTVFGTRPRSARGQFDLRA